jgi:hypothetical protein
MRSLIVILASGDGDPTVRNLYSLMIDSQSGSARQLLPPIYSFGE